MVNIRNMLSDILRSDEGQAETPDVDFTEMSDEEFWEYIVEENVESTNLSPEELREKPIWEIEEILDIELSDISYPKGNRGGFHINNRKKVITPEERQERKKRVNETLDIE